MSDTDGQGFNERTKLRKQLTQRKRGKEPSAGASSAPEETKSAVSNTSSKSSRKQWFFSPYLKKWVPSYLTQKPTSKIAFDVAFFTVSAIVICKLGQ